MKCSISAYPWIAVLALVIQGYEAEVFKGAPTLVLNNLQMTLANRLLLDIQSQSSKTLHGYLGWLPLGSNLTYSSCSGDDSPSEAACFQYGGKMKLTVRADNIDCSEGRACDSVSCHKVSWENHLTGTMDCFQLGEDLWYGGGERLIQRWPLQKDFRPWYAFLTGDPAHTPTGSVLENLWINSAGFLIFVDRNVPLFLSFNESNNGKLCFSTSLKKYPYSGIDIKDKTLSYTVCSADNIREGQEYAIDRWLGKPIAIPDEKMFLDPVWSTWARYKTDINQKKVIDFAQEIMDNDFPNSHVEIDDMWQSCYGELEFDLTKFPNPKQMVIDLNNMGFRTTLWVHPFCNINCKHFQEGTDKGYFIKDLNGKVIILEWWDGTAAMLDSTNEAAVEWFVSRLESLKTRYGIDSFKFDAGEVRWLPEHFQLHDKAGKMQPNLFTQKYTEMAARLGGMVEVRSAWNSQHLPIFVRMYDKDSRWSYNNGLKTLIPTSLYFSHMGYPFILPDMVGGNNYGAKNGSLPSRELYIRWLQANTFLPSIQFSILPWEYDKEVIRIAAKYIQLHQKFGTYILNAARQSVLDGTPMIRPMWWLAPEDPKAWVVDSQFLLGEKLLVAPILEKGKRKRDVYLPEGSWMDMIKGEILEGPQVLSNYKAELDELPFFLLKSTGF